MGRPLRDLLEGPVLDAAPHLLGRLLVGGGVTVRITEVEAYAGADDPGSHAFRGRTPRTQVMFGPPGRAYVYFSYGMHWCCNVVVGPVGEPGAVLLRAGQVIDGTAQAQARRPGASARDLCRGPARLCKALDVTGAHDGVDLLAATSAVRLMPGEPVEPGRVRSGPRVGVSGAGGVRPWRFWVDGEPSVSAYRAAVRRAARP